MTDPKPDMRPVTSSVATHAGYDPVNQRLHVLYMTGKHFAYEGVPIDKAETVMGAHSFGSALNRHILGKHDGKRVG